MSTPGHTESPIHPLLKLAKSRKIKDLEAAWMKAIEQNPLDEKALFATAAYVAQNIDPDLAGTLLWMLVNSASENRPVETAFSLAVLASRIAPNDDSLREELLALYPARFQDDERIPSIVDVSGLDAGVPLDRATSVANILINLTRGTYVIKKGVPAPGRVERINAKKKKLEITLAGAETALGPEELLDLNILPADDFRALYEFEPEKLGNMSEDDPAGLVKKLLKTFGSRAEFKDLKKRLSPAVIPLKKWNSWWNAARPLLTRDPMITMTDDRQPYFVLRKSALSFEEKFRMRLLDADRPVEKIRMVLEFLSDRDREKEADPAFAKMLENEITKIVETSPPPIGLAALAARREIENELGRTHHEPNADAAALAEKIGDSALVPELIADVPILKKTLSFLKDTLPDAWAEIFAGMFPASTPPIADEIAKALSGAGHADMLKDAAAVVMKKPFLHPQALAWIWKNVFAGKFPEALAGIDKLAVSLSALRTAERLSRLAREKKELREARSTLTSALSQKDAANLRSLAETLDRDGARAMKDALESALCLNDVFIENVFGTLRRHHWEIFEEKVNPWEDGFVYSTAEALKKRSEEFQELTTVTMAENAAAIGTAAEQGDISDNADFRVALQERDFLAERATRMQEELKKVRTINSGMLAKGVVGIGSKVEMEFPDTGEKWTCTFLGPWDTDEEKNIFSYRAPLGLAFMGRTVGDTVTIPTPDGEREVKIISTVPGV